MSNAVLLTGGTGFLGTQIASELLEQTEKPIYALVRAKDEAAARLKAAWKDRTGLYDAVGSRILPVAGDLAAADLGLGADMAEMKGIRHQASAISHQCTQKTSPVFYHLATSKSCFLRF